MESKDNTVFWVFVVLAIFLFAGGRLPTVVRPPINPPLIIMLHEALHGPLPAYATGAARDLVAAGRDVRTPDDDEVTGTGEIPQWLKPALAPGRAILGGSEDSQQKDDALVLLAGERVLKAIKLPDSKEAILEACK